MTHATYLRYEILRNFRNVRFLILALAFRLVLYFAVAQANRHTIFNGTAFPLYFMVAMATLGTMAAVISSAAIIAAERSSGWTRQMRITPLSTGAYFGAKVLNGYLRALLTIALMRLAGTALGVRLSTGEWLTVIGLLLVGLIPFTVLGILLGHLVGVSSPAGRPSWGTCSTWSARWPATRVARRPSSATSSSPPSPCAGSSSPCPSRWESRGRPACEFVDRAGGGRPAHARMGRAPSVRWVPRIRVVLQGTGHPGCGSTPSPRPR
jgi:hypothetical protein